MSSSYLFDAKAPRGKARIFCFVARNYEPTDATKLTTVNVILARIFSNQSPKLLGRNYLENESTRPFISFPSSGSLYPSKSVSMLVSGIALFESLELSVTARKTYDVDQAFFDDYRK